MRAAAPARRSAHLDAHAFFGVRLIEFRLARCASACASPLAHAVVAAGIDQRDQRLLAPLRDQFRHLFVMRR